MKEKLKILHLLLLMYTLPFVLIVFVIGLISLFWNKESVDIIFALLPVLFGIFGLIIGSIEIVRKVSYKNSHIELLEYFKILRFFDIDKYEEILKIYEGELYSIVISLGRISLSILLLAMVFVNYQ